MLNSKINGFSAPLYDFINSEVTFNQDGSLTESLDIGTITTRFTDSGIVSTLKESDGTTLTKTTVITNNKIISTLSV